jgi:hypothetical protein
MVEEDFTQNLNLQQLYAWEEPREVTGKSQKEGPSKQFCI